MDTRLQVCTKLMTIELKIKIKIKKPYLTSLIM